MLYFFFLFKSLSNSIISALRSLFSTFHYITYKYSNKKENITTYKEYIHYLIQFGHIYNKRMRAKYSEYTLDKLARAIWKHTLCARRFNKCEKRAKLKEQF